MFNVVKRGKQMQAELVSTAYRGSAVYIRYLTTQGNVGVSIPYNSAQSAKSWMIVDWVPDSGIEYSDNATGADRMTSTPAHVVCHYGGIYRTNRFVSGYTSTYKYRTGLATVEATEYGGAVGNPYLPYPHLWVIGSAHATYPGSLTDTTRASYTGFDNSFARIASDGKRLRALANFWLRGIDNASSDSGSNSVQQTQWLEFESIPYRIGKAWTGTAIVDDFSDDSAL